MFEQSLLVNSAGKSRKASSVLASITVQCLGVGLLVLLPTIFGDKISLASVRGILTVPTPPPPAAPAEPPAKPAKPTKAKPKPCSLCAPKELPKHPAAKIKDADEPPPENEVAKKEVPEAVPGGISGGLPKAGPPPAAPQPTPKSEPEKPKVVAQTPKGPVRVGGDVKPPVLIHKVTPIYPALAKSVRMQGTVRFTGIIGRDGTIQQLQLVSGPPLLVAAATEAVKQWVYSPTTLNGEPVEVITQIDVNFTLSN